MPYYASLNKIASAETALGAPIALEDSLVLKQLVVALGNVTAGGGGGGSGDVVGPASSTDNAIAAFDGATGKLLKNSNLLVGAGTLTFPGAVSGTAVLQAPPIAGSAAVTLPSVTGTLAIIGNNVSQFAAGGTLSSLTGFSLRSTGAAFDLSLATDEVLTANRTLKFNVGNADRTLTIPATGTAALLGTANVFTTLQTITQANANTGILASTGYSLTGSNATSMIDLAGTWNTSGTPTAIKLNITDTASNSASLLMDLQTGGTSRFKVSKTGTLTLVAGQSLILSTVGGSPQLLSAATDQATFSIYGVVRFSVAEAGAFLASTGYLGWSNDLLLYRKAAATLQLGQDAAPVTNQMFTAASRITSNGAGANLTIAGGNCRGTTGQGGVGGSLIFSTYAASVTSDTIGTLTTRLTINTLGEIIPVLPTSSAGLTTGALWNNSGVVNVA